MWGPRPLLLGSGPGSQGHGALLTPGSEASEEHTGSTTGSGRGLVPAAKTKAGGVCASKGSQRHHLLSVHPHSPCPDQALWFLLPGQAALPRWPILHPMGAQGPALCPSWALGHLTSSLGLRPHLCADLPWLLEVPPITLRHCRTPLITSAFSTPGPQQPPNDQAGGPARSQTDSSFWPP